LAWELNFGYPIYTSKIDRRTAGKTRLVPVPICAW
jgi:hypothetical protein